MLLTFIGSGSWCTGPCSREVAAPADDLGGDAAGVAGDPGRDQAAPLLADPSAPLHVGLVLAAFAILAVGLGLALPRPCSACGCGRSGSTSWRRGAPACHDARLVVVAMLVAGGLGGLAGAIMLQGEQYMLKAGFTSGYGFDGLVVGLLARGSAAGVVRRRGAVRLSALRWHQHGDRRPACRPPWCVVIQGLVVIAIAGSAILSSRQRTAAMSEEQIAVFLASSLRLAMPLMLAAPRRDGQRARRRAEHEPRGHDADGRLRRRARLLGDGQSRRSGSPDRCGRGAAGGLLQALLSMTLRANQIVSRHRHQHPGARRARRWPTARSSAPARAQIIPRLRHVGAADFGDNPGDRQTDLPNRSGYSTGGGAIRAGGVALKHTALGLAIRAVGDDPRAARPVPAFRSRACATAR